MRLPRRLVALLAVPALLVGCSGGSGEGSALDLGQTPGTICVPRGADEAKTFGAVDLHNVTDSEVTVIDIGLAEADGLEVVGARVLPSTRESQIVADGWPPRAGGSEMAWAGGADATGAVLEPQQVLTLWTGVRAPSGDGNAEALRVHYRHAGRTFWQDSVDALQITSRHSC